MADTVKVSALRENITECPICTEEFDDKSKIPRRMSCCGQPICEECLVRYVRRRTVFPCPLCKVNNNIPGGVRSLSKDMTVLRLLEVLKTQKTKPQSTGDGRRPGASSEDASKLKEKQDKIIKKMTKLFSLEENIDMSEKIAKEQINQRFEDMVEELQQRRVILLSEVEAKALQERRSVTRALESHKSLLVKLKSASESGQPVASLLQETADDVDADRIGIAFAEANMQQLLTAIRSAGQVRLITFTPTQKPSWVPLNYFANAVTFKPEDFPEVDDADVTISTGDKVIISPLLEFCTNTAAADIQVSTGVVRNVRPDPVPQDTRCRLQSLRRTMSLRPLPLSKGQIIMFCSRVEFTVNKHLCKSGMMWELSLTNFLVDADFNQQSGVSVSLRTDDTDSETMSIVITFDGEIVSDEPFITYEEGISGDLQLCFMIDSSTETIHVVDVKDFKVIAQISALIARPLWVAMYVTDPSHTKMKSQLTSGRECNITPEIKDFLVSLL